MALATLQDFFEVTGSAATNLVQTERLLEDASSRLLRAARRYHGQEIIQATRTEVLRPVYGGIRFPQRPVTAVASVIERGRTLTADVDYRWTPGGDGEHAYLIRCTTGVDTQWAGFACDGYGVPIVTGGEVTVTYTAGWDPIPPELVNAVVRMVANSIVDDSRQGATSETTGPFSTSWRDPQGTDQVPGHVMSLIDELCGVPGPVNVPIVAG